MKYLVIGLGTYGRELAINLSLQGNEVIGVDHRSENIEAVKEQLMTVYELDAKDENSLKLLPLKNMDIVIVAIGEDFGASLKTVALLKKNGVKHIYARAIDNLHQSILEAFNLERILTPEKRAANDLTLELSLNTQCSTFNITKDFMVLKLLLHQNVQSFLMIREIKTEFFGAGLLSEPALILNRMILFKTLR